MRKDSLAARLVNRDSHGRLGILLLKSSTERSSASTTLDRESSALITFSSSWTLSLLATCASMVTIRGSVTESSSFIRACRAYHILLQVSLEAWTLPRYSQGEIPQEAANRGREEGGEPPESSLCSGSSVIRLAAYGAIQVASNEGKEEGKCPKQGCSGFAGPRPSPGVDVPASRAPAASGSPLPSVG